MTKPVLIALAQMNAHLGKVNANVSRLAEARAKSALQGAEIIVTPEMFLSGYPCDDLVLRNDFMADVAAGIDQLTELTSDGGPAIVVGAPAAIDGAIYNSVFVLDGGKQLARFDKVNLPNYGVFDDKRNFTAGQMPGPAMLRGLKIGFPICEDIWEPNVAECLEESGADLIIAINASPFDISKPERRMSTIVARTVETGLPVAYVNMVGGQDELVYDGSSFAINAGGKLACHLPSFSESIVVISAQKTAGMVALTGQITPPDSDLTALYRGLCLGLRDYVHKNGFPGVLLGLSGGIDSALVAALAVDALGAEAVHAVMMPSAFTSQESLDDAAEMAAALGIRLDTIAITPAVDALGTMLADQFAGTAPNVAEENIQSRLRGLILMGISNKHGAMVLATGNKSEYAAGYSTLYGDMCGGYAPLKDVWKVDVFRLCEWRNRHLPRGAAGPEGVVIPQAIIDKPPSAELRPDQKDTDSLPPYDQLDAIMAALCEEMADIETIVARGYNRDDVTQASQLLFRAEYKRFQAAPGPKMTPVAFGRDRRLPLTSGFNPIKR
ncbi:MAG: NAD+ synthase [Alphaproteobacteria bacterium]|jgi:NAD+ synthase|nr:NAD+ synthase [Alphaproteobacteria bacterium]NCW30033.1 NAD+ synthase [Alphaproteobacteria bacterium]NDG36213.1 NAD+ synthase [Alphaproteobacteria bacterium]